MVFGKNQYVVKIRPKMRGFESKKHIKSEKHTKRGLNQFFIFLGKKIFLGIALSLSFELTSRVGAAISIGFSVSPLLSAILPSLGVMILAIVLLRHRSSS